MKKVLWAVAFMFIIGIFFWYGTGGLKTYAAKVNGSRIELRDFQAEYSRRLMRFRQESEESLTDETAASLRQQTLASLINQELLLQEAKRLGIRVSDEEIINTIQSLPQFQHEGEFNMHIYRQTLQFNLDMSPGDFEEMIKKNIAAQKLERFIISSAVISEPELKLYYQNRHQTLENFEQKGLDLREEILQKKRSSLYNHWMGNITRRASIDINQDIIQPPRGEREEGEAPSPPL